MTGFTGSVWISATITDKTASTWLSCPARIQRDTFLPLFDVNDFRQGGRAHNVDHDRLPYGAYFHSGFGAPCEGTSFNGRDQWAQRGNASLREMAARLAGVDNVANIVAMVDRKFIKFHGAGAEEFLHVDLNGKCLTQPRSGHEGLQGKYMATDGGFLMSAGSHKMTTDDWAKYMTKDKIPRGDKFSIKEERRSESALGAGRRSCSWNRAI